MNQVRFVIMGNLFCTEYTIHRRFDLKGSSHGRTTDKPEEEIDGNTTLKDLDLNFIFRLQKEWFQDFQRWIQNDYHCLFQILHVLLCFLSLFLLSFLSARILMTGKWTGTVIFSNKKELWIIVFWWACISGKDRTIGIYSLRIVPLNMELQGVINFFYKIDNLVYIDCDLVSKI